MFSETYLDEFLGDIGCFVEGGSSRQINLHTAGAQAWYYGSRYQDVEEEFELYAIPSIKGGTTAHVNYFGAVLPSSDYPEAAFYFLKYLMDSEIDPFFGLSVNRELTEKQLDYYVNTTYLMRHGLKITLEDGELPDSPRDYVIQPMKEETKEKLLTIIDDIESVTLPSWPVYFIIDTQIQKYAKGESTLEDAYHVYLTDGRKNEIKSVPLKEFMLLLQEQGIENLCQISRNQLINLHYISSIVKIDHSRIAVRLVNLPTEFIVGKQYEGGLLTLLAAK